MFLRCFQAEGSARRKVLKRSILGFHDKEGEDQCVWIRVRDGERDFIHPFNKCLLGAVLSWTLLCTGDTEGAKQAPNPLPLLDLNPTGEDRQSAK